MTSKAGRYAAGAAVGLTLALSVTACKGVGTSGDGKAAGGGVHLTAAQDVLAEVSGKTGGITTFRGTASFDIGISGQQTGMKGTMAYRRTPTPAMKFDVAHLNVNGRQSAGFHEVALGDMLYMKMPALAKRAGKPWIGISLSKLGATTGMNLNGLQNQSQTDPSTNVKMFTASKDARKVGQETIHGVATTHYTGTYDMQAALAKLSPEQRSQAQKGLAVTGLNTMHFDVWVDGQQLPRRISLASPAGAKMDMKVTMDYTAFNAPVSITAPPKSQVADGAPLLGGGANNIPG